MKKLFSNKAKGGHKKGLIAFLAIVLVLVCAFLFYYENNKKQTVSNDVTYEEIARRTIVSSVSGTGTVVSANSETVSTNLFGSEVLTVNVSEGDVVSEGTLIATLDTSSLQEQKQSLQDQISSLRSSQLEYHETFQASQTNSEAARQTQITNVTERLNAANTDLEAAKNDLATTQAEYDALVASTQSSEETSSTEDVSGDLVNNLSAQPNVYSLQLVLETKKTNVSTLQARVDTLQDTLDALNAGETANTSDALAEYDETVNSSVNSLQERVNELQEQIDRGNVTCVTSGTVTSVNVEPGDLYTGSTIAMIEGVDTLVVEAQIDEYDIADVTVGMPVMMKTDATREEELQGTVIYVAPKSSSGGSTSSDYSSLLSGMGFGDLTGATNNSATYLVRISIDTGNDRLRLGMNAKVSIILAESEDVLSVPLESVQTDADGNTYIQVKDEDATAASEDGQIVNKRIDVTTGMEGTYYIEITGDVEEGMEVLIPSSSSEESVDDLINMMGAAGGV